MKPRAFWIAILALLPPAIILFQAPLPGRMPGFDQGVYAYIGWRVLQGDVPYRDLWDHKPLGIYFVNALGLLITPTSLWGIRVLELASLYVAVLLGWMLLKRLFGADIALAVSIIWLWGASLVWAAGNGPQVFALPLQFGVLLLVAQMNSHRSTALYGFAVGVTAGLALLLKHNLIGLWLAIVLYAMFAGAQNRTWRLASLLAGTLAVLAIPLLYLTSHQALAEAWQATVAFNLHYVAQTRVSPLRALFQGLRWLAPAGLPIFALAGWLQFVATRRPARETVLAVAALALPLELILATLPGSTSQHYFVAWLPVFALFAGVFVDCGLGNTSLSRAPSEHSSRSPFPVRLMSLTLAVSLLPAMDLVRAAARITYVPADEQAAIETAAYIRANSDESDSILVWGAGPAINFAAQRRSPTRFTYQTPFYWNSYLQPDKVDEFVRALQLAPPTLIVDVSSRGSLQAGEQFGSQTATLWRNAPNFLTVAPVLSRLADFVAHNYEIVALVGEEEFRVYRWLGSVSDDRKTPAGDADSSTHSD